MSLLSLLGISTVHAATTPEAPSLMHTLSGTLPLLILFAVFIYFLMIRPQSKRAKEQRNLLDSLKVGDEVITIGGLFGKIAKITEDGVMLTIAKGVDIALQKQSVANSLPKGSVKNI